MMYPYITLYDETLITHSQVLDKGGVKSVEVHFERPVEYGFDSARCVLPSYEWMFIEGYSDEEIQTFEHFLRGNAHLLYRYAEGGGVRIT